MPAGFLRAECFSGYRSDCKNKTCKSLCCYVIVINLLLLSRVQKQVDFFKKRNMHETDFMHALYYLLNKDLDTNLLSLQFFQAHNC